MPSKPQRQQDWLVFSTHVVSAREWEFQPLMSPVFTSMIFSMSHFRQGPRFACLHLILTSPFDQLQGSPLHNVETGSERVRGSLRVTDWEVLWSWNLCSCRSPATAPVLKSAPCETLSLHPVLTPLPHPLQDRSHLRNISPGATALGPWQTLPCLRITTPRGRCCVYPSYGCGD